MNYLSCSTIREVIVLCCVCSHQSWVQAPSLVLQPQALSDVLQHFFHHLQKFCLSIEVKHIKNAPSTTTQAHLYYNYCQRWSCSSECEVVCCWKWDFVISTSKYLNNQTWYNRISYTISLRLNWTLLISIFHIIKKFQKLVKIPLFLMKIPKIFTKWLKQ